MYTNDLLREIEDCRSDMVHLATATSLSNQQVVETSIKLDHLLNKYYTLKVKK